MSETIRPKLSFLSDASRERIFAEAVEVLEKFGIMVEDDEALRLLADGGARVTRKKRRAYLSSQMVEKALETAPKEIRLYDRMGGVFLTLSGDNVHFDPGSAAITVYDYEIGELREPTTSDFVKFARLTDRLSYLKAQSTCIVPTDIPREIADRYRLFLALGNCTKPVVTGTFVVDGFGPMKEMLIAVRGDEEELRKKPLAIFDCCPSPPLRWSKLTVRSLIDCARAGIPAEIISMPLTGATSPATLYSTVTQAVAENLSGIVISQLACPSAPVIFGGSPSAFDMRKGTTPMGAIETMMIDLSYAEVAKELGFPTHAYLGLSDAKLPDFQAGLETSAGILMAALGGINMVSGPGMLSFESTMSLEKLVIDNDICGMAYRLIAGVAPDEVDFALKEILTYGERGNFLGSPETRKRYRKELMFPSEAIDRGGVDEWLMKGKPSAFSRAHDIVSSLLSGFEGEPLPAGVLKELNRIIVHEASRFGVDKLPDEAIIRG
jgi:trimethylamine--corrinoid protein Co-methyltransferase